MLKSTTNYSCFLLIFHKTSRECYANAGQHNTCLMLKLDTVKIIVGLLQMSSGRTQREKMAVCLGDKASFPHLSLQINESCDHFT